VWGKFRGGSREAGAKGPEEKGCPMTRENCVGSVKGGTKKKEKSESSRCNRGEKRSFMSRGRHTLKKKKRVRVH